MALMGQTSTNEVQRASCLHEGTFWRSHDWRSDTIVIRLQQLLMTLAVTSKQSDSSVTQMKGYMAKAQIKGMD